MLARENPFAVHRVLAYRYRFGEDEWAALFTRLTALGFRAAIVGEEGRGKTTLLEDLGRRLGSRGVAVRAVTVRPEGGMTSGEREVLFGGSGEDGVLLVDGADALPAREWRRVRRSRRLVVTSHREGLLSTLHRAETTPGMLAEMVLSLSGSDPARFGVTAEDLFRRHGGNLRDAIRDLYDACAALPSPA